MLSEEKEKVNLITRTIDTKRTMNLISKISYTIIDGITALIGPFFAANLRFPFLRNGEDSKTVIIVINESSPRGLRRGCFAISEPVIGGILERDGGRWRDF